MTTTQPAYELVIERGPQPGQTFPLDAPSHTVGRDPISDLCISDPEVSRQHGLLIQMPKGGYKIQDLGSTNGTIVDGTRLSGEAYPLQPGQLITLGGSVALRYRAILPAEAEAKAAEPAPVKQAPPTPAPAPAQEVQVSAPAAEAPMAEAAASVELQSGEPAAEWRDQLPVRAQPTGQAANVPPAGRRATEDDFVDSETPDEDDPGRRLLSIALGVLLVLLCFCCSFTLFMYYFGGDWLLRQFGIVP